MTTHTWHRRSLLAALALTASLAAAQSQPSPLPPAELVKQVIYNELHPPANSNLHWRYKLQKQVDGRQETWVVVETSSGTLDRLLAIGGKPLTPGQKNAEAERIMQFSHNRAQQQKAEQAREKERQQSDQLMKMIPSALVFEYAGQHANAVKLTFRPNPQFRPSSREGKVLQQMSGEMWVDANEKRLISITGVLMDDVKFGGGLLGHLEKGGQFAVTRAEVAPQDWELTRLMVNMHGKAVLFKSISVQQREVHSNFERVPDELTLPDAANLLLRQTVVASNQTP